MFKSKRYLGLLVAGLLMTMLCGLLYAQSVSTTSITITASPASDVTMTWTEGKPVWTPIHGVNGSITAGGLMFVAFPSVGTRTVTVHLQNPAAIDQAYSYLTMKLDISQPGHAAFVGGKASLLQAWVSVTALDPPVIGLLHPDNGLVVFELTTTAGLPGIVEGGVLKAVQDAETATHRLFALGIAAGAYRTRGMGGSLSPEFYVEITR